VRFTTRDDNLYAICLGWPTGPLTIQSLKCLYPGEIASVSMLGSPAPLVWSLSPQGLTIQPPPEKPCEHACVFKIERSRPFMQQNR
jgi:alpha-L-fucosidase